jgi:hypothetical protein
VGDVGVRSHLASVVQRGLGEDGIAAEGLEPSADAIAIGGGKQILLGDRAIRVAWRRLSLDLVERCAREKE